ncbi:MAG TPA: M48 family metallopeptidase [bacterium]|nr:M48 family metallopeptidase [bacterium]
MLKTIKINNQQINYQLKTSYRTKNIRLSIYGDGRFIVTKPYFISKTRVEKFIITKSNWIISKLKKIVFSPYKNYLKPEENKKRYRLYKEPARRLIENKIKKLNEFYGFKYNHIAIRNQTTRWGSCSKKGNLNFNYKLIFLPEKMIDYIITHELCHLKEFNHSKRFWQLISLSIPDYLGIKYNLKHRI